MDGFYKLRLCGRSAGGEEAENVAVYEVVGSNPLTTAYHTAREVAETFNTAVVNHLLPCLGSSAFIDFITAQKFDAPPGPYARKSVGSAGTFGKPAASFVQACDIRLKPGGAANRSGHWFIWGLPSEGFISGRLSPTLLSAIDTFALALVTHLSLSVGDARLQTMTRHPAGTPPTFTPVTNFEIASKATGLNRRSLPLY